MGKFGLEDGYNNVKTGGLNGVGASCCNATSDFCNLYPIIDGTQYVIGFEKGITTTPLSEVGPVEEGQSTHGTLVHLRPDVEIWEDEKFDIDAIVRRMEQLAFLNAGLTITLEVDYEGKELTRTFFEEEGTKAYVAKLIEKKTPLFDTLRVFDKVKDNKTDSDIEVEIALVYTDALNEEIYTFVNNIPTHMGGSHLTGFKEGLFRPIQAAYDDAGGNKNKMSITSDDAREGLTAIVSLKVTDPNFEGQGKAKINMPKVRAAVRQITEEFMSDMLDKDPDMRKIIINKALDACRAREAAKNARDNARKKKSLISGGLPGKLAGCKNKNPEESEIFLVEGDSAAGTAKNGRDRNTQAILPVFGKINNVEKSSLAAVLDSVKMRDIISALECSIADEFDIDKLRYHKIIIFADADVDGSHICTLWITFFFRFYRELIEKGYLYIACPPLYKIVKGKREIYAYTDAEKEEIISTEFGGSFDKIQRYKGLGEMNAEQLWDTTMNPETRRLIQVSIDDLELDEQMLVTCMGEEVAPRREFIMNTAAQRATEGQFYDEDHVEIEEM